jgi:hypothetical protein
LIADDEGKKYEEKAAKKRAGKCEEDFVSTAHLMS